MSDLEQQVREVYENTQCGIYEPWESLRPGTQLFYTIFAAELRKRWEAEHTGKMVPIAGPPDLDDVPIHSLYLIPMLDGSIELYNAAELRVNSHSRFLVKAKWHIPLGVIAEPEELPKCPWCGNPLTYKTDSVAGGLHELHWFECDEITCVWNGETYQSEAEAIQAAKNAGKGE